MTIQTDKIQALIQIVISKKNNISYINLDNQNKYAGWTQDFKLTLPNGDKMSLNLKADSDLFLLFVLASSWSKTGQWENAANFISYLKLEKKYNINYWLDDNNIREEINSRKIKASKVERLCKGMTPRKKISFRKDYYPSIKVLAINWDNLILSLEKSVIENNFNIFINTIYAINGLGSNNNKMRIKIPLILRELKCQNVYDNIPGEYCCVPDERVYIACRKLGIVIPKVTNLKSLLKASKIIYKYFGDLYDIPLFALQDLKEELTII